MRYEKGSIAISVGQDLPLLRQVLESQFVTHDQLFQFMRHGCYELKRSSFNWRVLRLVRKGFLDRHSNRASCVYSISSAGASFLAASEEYCPVLRRQNRFNSSYDHALELNELHLGLIRQGILERWTSEVAIRSRNELTNDGYAKDYDAVIAANMRGNVATFALEYERTPKKPSDYLRIRGFVERETHVPQVLYVVPNTHLASLILNCFSGISAELRIGLATDFSRSLIDMPVTDARTGRQHLGFHVL
jgi:hypothetical protein